jgi:phytoene desaturase
MLYLGVDRKLDELLHHNFYLSSRYKENFEAIFRDRALPGDPSFYAVVASRTEPRMAPEGMDTLFVLVPVPHLSPKVDWRRDGPAFREKVYGLLEERCGIRDLRERVVYERVRTPEDWRDDYNLEEGAAFGIGHGIFQVGYFRPPMVSGNIKDLYFVGASTRPGTGVPLVTIGAKLVAERIRREIGAA